MGKLLDRKASCVAHIRRDDQHNPILRGSLDDRNLHIHHSRDLLRMDVLQGKGCHILDEHLRDKARSRMGEYMDSHRLTFFF